MASLVTLILPMPALRAFASPAGARCILLLVFLHPRLLLLCIFTRMMAVNGFTILYPPYPIFPCVVVNRFSLLSASHTSTSFGWVLRVSIHIHNPCSMKSNLSPPIDSSTPTDSPRELVCLVRVQRDGKRTSGSTLRISLSGLSFPNQYEGWTNLGSTPLCVLAIQPTIDFLNVWISPFSGRRDSVICRDFIL